jgi:hypothetical protein
VDLSDVAFSQASTRQILKKSHQRKKRSQSIDLHLYQSKPCIPLRACTQLTRGPARKARETVKAREEEEAEALEAQKREEEAREQRRLDSKLLAGETIRRELAESMS